MIIHRTLLSSLLLASLGGCGDDSDAGSRDVGPSDSALDAMADSTDRPDASADAAVGCSVAPLCGEFDIVEDATWLNEHLDDTDVQIIDTRGSAFEGAHIPGALLIDVGELRASVDGIDGQVVDAATAENVFRATGVRNEAAVIIYGADTTTTPSRLVWTFEHFGHERVALLDGGFAAWQSAGYETESGAFVAVPSEYTIEAIDPDRRVGVDYILPRLTDGSLQLVDARTSSEFDAGHLPGASSVDWMRNVLDGSLIPEAELVPLYESLDPNITVAAYCQTGSRASVTYVVLRALGFRDVRLYDGSWAEWGSRPELPREP